MVPNDIPSRLKRRHAQLGLRRSSLPPLLLDVDQDADSLLFFGPGNAMYLPDGSSGPDQSLQLIPASVNPPVESGLSIAVSQAPFFVPSDGVSVISQSQQPSARVSPLPSRIPTTITHFITESSAPAAQASSSAPAPSSATQQANTSTPPGSSSQPQAQQIQSQISGTITALPASTTTSTETPHASLESSSATSISDSSVKSHTETDTTSSVSSTTASTALASSSSTQAATHSENLPHLAEIVLGVVAAISVIAVLATLVSWYYKQRKRRSNHAEIVSLNSSAYDHSPRGFFGCLRKRRSKNPEEMSELGFGLSHVDFFGVPNPSDEDHRLSLALRPENVFRDGENLRGDVLLPSRTISRDPLVSRGFAEGPYPTALPLPVYLSNPTPSSRSLSPSRYQQFGGIGTTPLMVANLAPGDLSSDENVSGDDNRRSGTWSVQVPQPVVRAGSLGTPRIGNGAPRFTRLEEDNLAVPWAPLHLRLQNAEEGNRSEDRGFEPLALSRTSTLSLALSRTFSQRLQHSLSKTADWQDGATRPPRGTFRAAWDQTAQAQPPDGAPGQDTWASTIRNNFYSALNAMSGSSIGAKGVPSRSNTGSVSTLPNPFSDASRQSSMRFPSDNSRQTQASSEDILALRPQTGATLAGRSKGSILRGRLGIEAPGRVGLGIDTLSRSSTLSTTWSDAETIPQTAWTAQHTRVLDRQARRSRLIREGTRSTASSLSSNGRTTLKQKGRGQTSRAPSKRPRYSRMPVSQSSVWSSESYASSGVERQR